MRKPFFVRLSDAALEHLSRSIEYYKSKGQSDIGKGDLIERLIAFAPIDDESAVTAAPALPPSAVQVAYAALSTGNDLTHRQWKELARLVADAYRGHRGVIAADLLIHCVQAFGAVRALRPLAAEQRDTQALAALDAEYLQNLVDRDDQSPTLDQRIQNSVRRSCARYAQANFFGPIDAPGELLATALDAEPVPDPRSLSEALKPHLSALLRVALRRHVVVTGVPFPPATPPRPSPEAYWAQSKTGCMPEGGGTVFFFWVADAMGAAARLHLRCSDSETVIETNQFPDLMDLLRVIDRAVAAPNEYGIERGRFAYTPWTTVDPRRPHSLVIDKAVRINLSPQQFEDLGRAARGLMTTREVVAGREQYGYIWGEI